MHLLGWLLEQLLSPKSFPFGVVITWTFFSEYCSFWEQLLLRGLFDVGNFCKDNVTFSKLQLQASILWSSVSFYLTKGIATGHSFFNRTGFFWRISLNHSFFHVGRLFLMDQLQPFILSGAISYGTDNFWQQLLIKNSYFFGRPILGIQYF